MTKALALIVTLLAFPAVSFADAVDEFMVNQMQRHQIPGISLAICRDRRHRGARLRQTNA